MLEVAGLSKTFRRGSPPALRDVSFRVERGRICGLLGHNGAGKSTALGAILGMVHPDAGEATIGGVSVQRRREAAIKQVGAIFETPAFYDYLSGWHNLRLLSAYSGGVSRGEIEEVVAWVGLSERIRERVSGYSHGMRQRLALAQALLPRPRLLVLDEPTDGLDPEGIVEFRRRLLELRDRFGITVLLSSHLLAEVEQVCDEVVILQRGVKVYEGGAGAMAGGRTVYEIDAADRERMREVCRELGGEPLGEDVAFPADEDPAAILRRLVEAGVAVSRFAARSDSLESIYLQFSRAGEGESASGDEGKEGAP